MKTERLMGWMLGAFAGLAAAGCAVSADKAMVPTDEAVGEARGPAITQNAITQNAITQNAITQNAITQNAITQNAITQEALNRNAILQDALGDPLARMFLSYVVSCALPEDVSLTYTGGEETYVFHGGLGLAPEWGRLGGACDEECQQWVSACVLSRVDFLGVHVTISVRGPHPQLLPEPYELSSFRLREGTYYGNLFSQPPRYLGCLPPGVTWDLRPCGPDLSTCIIGFQGSCGEVCDGALRDGGYYGCKGPSDDEEGLPMTYDGNVTVYLEGQ